MAEAWREAWDELLEWVQQKKDNAGTDLERRTWERMLHVQALSIHTHLGISVEVDHFKEGL